MSNYEYNTYGQPMQPQMQYVTPPVQFVQVIGPRNGLGIAGLSLGIVGILFGLAPLTFWIAGPLGVLGLILALVGRGRAKRGLATNKKMSTGGVVTSLGALALSVIGAVIFFTAMNDLGDSLTCIGNASTAEQVDAC